MSAPDLAVRPRIAHGFRLQWEPAQNCHVLLYPEGMVKLNDSAGEILKRCDGSRSVSEVIDELQRSFGVNDIAADVIGFIEIAGQQRWLAWDDRA